MILTTELSFGQKKYKKYKLTVDKLTYFVVKLIMCLKHKVEDGGCSVVG